MEPPILRDFPEAFTTARLLLRCPLPGDGAALNAAILESLAELQPWMEWVDPVPTVARNEANLRQARCDYLARKELRLLLFDRATGEFVGSSGLHAIDWSVPRFEIGYWCRTRFCGQGYITEAVQGITTFAFEVLGAERVAIHCDCRNGRSRRVAERAGYQLEGVLRARDRRKDGSLEDSLVFSLVREDYGKLRLPPIQPG